MDSTQARAILLVDDEPLILTTLRIHLRHMLGGDAIVFCATSGAEAMELVQDHLLQGGDFALVIVDYQMHPMRGNELLEHLHERIPGARRVLLTGQADLEVVVDSMSRIDLFRYMTKPWDPDDLERTIREAMAG